MTNAGRPEDDGLGRQIRPSLYSPRRRRNDVIVTGITGFVVGAFAGLVALGLVALIGYLSAFLIDFAGLAIYITIVVLAGGVALAILAVRSST